MQPFTVIYDALADILMILFVPRETETIVHYVDEHIGYLYLPDSKVVVGMQLEGVKNFISQSQLREFLFYVPQEDEQ